MKEDIPTLPYKDKNDPWSSHGIIAGWLSTLPSKSKVLDIGTGSGTIGRLCNDFSLSMRGIEPNPDWARLARPYYEDFLNLPIEKVSDEFIKRMDAIILADVLEHLPDPETVLLHITSLQTTGCQMLISVPNVANLWIRLNLLGGRFEYTDRGILDRTHLHFYTRHSFERLLKQCGLVIRSYKVTPVPLNLLHPFFQHNPFGRLVFRIWAYKTQLFPTLLGYQFVAMATKKVDGE
jgi:hypothetical protein